MHMQYVITYILQSSVVNLSESGDTPGTSKSTSKKDKLVRSHVYDRFTFNNFV